MAEPGRGREKSYALQDEYPDDLEYRDSEEEIYYPTSNEVSRVDINQPRTSREGLAPYEFYRNYDEAIRGDADYRDQYIQNWQSALEKQDEEIRELNTHLRELREECREYFSSLEEKLSCFEGKVDLVINLVSSWTHHPSMDRRCQGFCTKHVRTEKCLCRGLKEPHRCCGRIGGICDC